MSYYHGQFASNEIMKEYVHFLCSCIDPNDVGACVNRTDGFPMKGHYIRVKIEFVKIHNQFVDVKIVAFGHEKMFPWYLSRRKDPNTLLHEFQRKVDDLTLEIITENGLDRDQIWLDYHPLKNLKLPNIKKEV